MSLVGWVILLALGGPLFAVAAVVADSRSGGVPLSRRRLVLAGLSGGAMVFGLAGLLIAIVPEGAHLALPVGVALGALVGALVGGIVAAIWRPREPRDRTA